MRPITVTFHKGPLPTHPKSKFNGVYGFESRPPKPNRPRKKKRPRHNPLNTKVTAIVNGERDRYGKQKEIGVAGVDAFGRLAKAHDIEKPRTVAAWVKTIEELNAAGRTHRWVQKRNYDVVIRVSAAPRARQPLCGAKTRKGGTCRQHALLGRKRCRLHGGLSTGFRTEQGKARAARASVKYWQAWRERRDAEVAARELLHPTVPRPLCGAPTRAGGFCTAHRVCGGELCPGHSGRTAPSQSPAARARAAERMRLHYENRRVEKVIAAGWQPPAPAPHCGAPRCGAPLAQGGVCRSYPMRGQIRCRVHNGNWVGHARTLVDIAKQKATRRRNFEARAMRRTAGLPEPPPPVPPQCWARLRNGKRCRCRPLPGDSYCFGHSDHTAHRRLEASSPARRAALKRGRDCRKARMKDAPRQPSNPVQRAYEDSDALDNPAVLNRWRLRGVGHPFLEDEEGKQ